MGGNSTKPASECLLDAASLKARFAAAVADSAFPCLGAKAAFNGGSYLLSVYDRLASDSSSEALASDLESFTQSEMCETNPYASFVAIFRSPLASDEEGFERLLWSQLQKLHQLDATKYKWDSSVVSDPNHPLFSFSLAGRALYVIGMHDRSSRLARRFPWPTLVFNPHEQFERLRHDGKWKRMQEAIRARDVILQGSTNPMLSDFGEQSEARQYSGRIVDKEWQPPFRAEPTDLPAPRCPFAH
ncbi:MAG: YqcI/YcgG family protein [Chthoniobacterales bacterium]|nr:YqcI/YcgG family protein [Chthoniobacterales bacterium]